MNPLAWLTRKAFCCGMLRLIDSHAGYRCSLDEAELTHIANVAAGLDRLVPKIAEAIKLVESENEYRRLLNLLRPAEHFLLEAGPLMSRAQPQDVAMLEICERFMRELPRRLRMVRHAQYVLPPVFEEDQALLSRAS